MHIKIFSAKGGVRCSTIAAGIAVVNANYGRNTILVDYSVDLPALLGIAQPYEMGYSAIEVADNLRLVSIDMLPHMELDDATVIHDVGMAAVPSGARIFNRRIFVTSSCYMAIRRAAVRTIDADGFILSTENGRALNAHDIYRVLNVPCLDEFNEDPIMARCIDAGLLTARVPQTLRRVADTVLELDTPAVMEDA